MTAPKPSTQRPNTAPFWGAGLRRVAAASYCGLSAGHFDKLVNAGIYPPGRNANGVTVWLRWELDNALEDLPVKGKPPVNSCDEVFKCSPG